MSAQTIQYSRNQKYDPFTLRVYSDPLENQKEKNIINDIILLLDDRQQEKQQNKQQYMLQLLEKMPPARGLASYVP